MSVGETLAPPGVEKPAPRSYYGRPVIKQPVWTWEIPVYFFTGGLAGASAGMAWLSERGGHEVLARRSWGIALGAVSASPGLLVSDLGRPGRFLNMLRMLKVTSPMSVGSWLLAASGGATAAATLHSWTGTLPAAGRAAKPVAALLGLPLSTYTAALVADTAVPVWHEARRTLPFVFAGGAAASAGAAAAIVTAPKHAAPARRLAVGGTLMEGAAAKLMERRLGELAEPYHEGVAGTLNRIADGTTAAGALVLGALGRRRDAAAAGAAMVLAGALCKRWAVFKAGFQSAADPRYTVGPQRERIRAGRSGGAERPA